MFSLRALENVIQSHIYTRFCAYLHSKMLCCVINSFIVSIHKVSVPVYYLVIRRVFRYVGYEWQATKQSKIDGSFGVNSL